MLIPIHEAAKKLNTTPSAIRGKISRGKLKGEKRTVDGKEMWFVSCENITPKGVAKTWEEFEKNWAQSMTTGAIYKCVIAPSTQGLYLKAIQEYFTLLGVAPSPDAITVQGLLTALDNVLPNEKGCRYARKYHVFTAWHSTAKVLVKMGKLSRLDILQANEYKPKRFTEAYQPHVTGDVLGDLLHVVNTWRMGKTYTDVKRLDLCVRMASYMGMRRGEIVGLKRSDYNQTERSLRVFGKGRKYRLLYVCNEVVEALDQWLEDTTCWGSPWVFPDRINGTHISGEAFYQQFTKILAHYNQMRKAQKLPPVKLHIHGLRHTAVTEWVKKGYSMDDISRWVGHSSPETTRRIYSHLTENDTFLMMKERLASV